MELVEGLSWTLLSILFIFWVKLEPTKLSLSMEVKISPPISIKAVMITSWVLENSSISTVDMLETVDADTAVKNRSRSASLMVVAFSTESFKARKPKTERMMYCSNFSPKEAKIPILSCHTNKVLRLCFEKNGMK
ncbi:unnamed protein product, partial [Vitis vinifera]|uniref:Uncharacterized protein n=1 Tax=Vitis vinifera TaxID=29760 RepID=D7UBM6_VITVI